MTRLRLELIEDGHVRQTFEPDGDIVRIGRAGGSDVSLSDARVALAHARLHVTEGGVTVEDLGSESRTCVLRGTTVFEVAAGTHLPLESGDRLLLGGGGEVSAAGVPSVELRLQLAPEEPPRVFEMRRMAELPGGANAPARVDATLRLLCEAQRHIGAARDLGGVATAVLDAVLSLVPRATHATLVLRDEGAAASGDAGFVPVLTRLRGTDGAGAPPAEPVRVARSVFRKVIRERAAVLAADAPSGELSSESLLGASIRSTIGVPLWRADEILGVLQLDNRAAPAMFTSADVDAVAVLSASASLAVGNARLIDRLRLAEEQLERENRFLKGRDRERRGSDGEIMGKSRAMLELKAQIGKVAGTRASVLIEGETGSGKELVAAAVHYQSRRQARLFVAQNCAALPEQLLESELFGHRRGAFTGATEDRKGLFELADGGTLFLDEVTEMPLSLQAKLLRVLQEGEVRPLGATQTRHVDVRIVAATNRDLEEEVKGGRFREDLYYRLKVFPLRVPALRERRDDIPLLAAWFLERYATEIGRRMSGIAHDTLELLTAYDWPGNVRELENEVQRLVIQTDDGAAITPDLLSPRIRRTEGMVASAGAARGTLRERMDQVERHLVAETLKDHGNNKTATAKALGITREGLHKKMKLLGMA